MRGLKRGLLGGFLLAIIVFFLPDSLLGSLTVGTGLASVLPAAAPPLGMTARLLLALVALLAGFALTYWLVRQSRPSWDVDDSFDDAPLPASEQMVVSPAAAASSPNVSPVGAPAAGPMANHPDIERRLAQLEAAVANLPTQITAAVGQAADAGQGAAVTARLEALEGRFSEMTSADGAGGHGLEAPFERRHMLRTAPGIGRKLADIRRALDA